MWLTIDLTNSAEIENTINVLKRHLTQMPVEGTPIRKLSLTTRAHNCLVAEGIQTVEQLCEKRRHELKGAPNLGKRSLKEIESRLQALGLSLTNRY